MVFKRIVVKVGSNVLTRRDGTLDVERMSAVVDQIAALREGGMEVLLVSSGAVASGRSEIKPRHKLDTVQARQLYSAVGQAKLINRYYDMFREHGITAGQVLTMKENFASRHLYLNQERCMTTMLDNGVIPIINENDTVSVTELMFTDNDELSGLVATMMNADALILLSNVDGIYDGNPDDPSSKVIRRIDGKSKNVTDYISAQKSDFGRGGMLTKYGIAMKVAAQGVAVVIANGKRDNILTGLMKKGGDEVATWFDPSEKPHPVKRWLAFSNGFAKGAIDINKGAYEALTGEKASSLLPVGVTGAEGTFAKDDIVKICYRGRQIGMGRTSFDSEKVRALSGMKGAKAVIHYDYLYLD